MRNPAARRAANLFLVLLGLALLVFGVASALHPSIDCRGVPMHPGDVCRKNDYTHLGSDKVQSYEQRLHAARLSTPVIAACGLGTIAFGAVLLRQDARRREPRPVA